MSLISICIPAYKNIEYLKRLLDSIDIQIFRDFEVVVTDDSPDELVKKLCEQYHSKFTIHYFRNQQTLGTPENWNEAIRRASGEWIKIMHDDDWFLDKDSLLQYVHAAESHPDARFIFAAYRNVYLNDQSTKDLYPPRFRIRQMEKNPATLIAGNIIGPPSVVLYKNDRPIYFDDRLKWLVDIDFYIRFLKNSQAFFIGKILTNIGVGEQQVTIDCFRQRPVEIPENFAVLNKNGPSSLKNILVFDAWWRLMRNLQITNPDEIREAGYSGEIPKAINSMIKWQKKIPPIFLKIGGISKAIMLANFIAN